EPEATGRARTDADGGSDGGIRWNLRAALRGHELHGTDEAGGVACGEQLFRIVAGATRAAELLRGGELDVGRAVEGCGVAVAAAGGLGGGLVEHIHGHRGSPFLVAIFDGGSIARN